MPKHKNISGWGRFPSLNGLNKTVSSKAEITPFIKDGTQFNPRGNGRSYGDSALHSRCLTTTGMSKIFSLSPDGLLHCGSGLVLGDILTYVIPKGFFLPVTPGTKFVTMGGAIAADIHGKNHHVHGNISNFIEEIEILDAHNNIHIASATDKTDLFWATCGGMGLTGVILSAKIRLTPIATSYIKQRAIKTKSLAHAIQLIQEHSDSTYSVAWIDCLKKGKSLGRSILLLGEHASLDELSAKQRKHPLTVHKKGKLNVPFNFPGFILNKLSIWAFNILYYHKSISRDKTKICHYEPYFYPLDGIKNWNRIYGKKGFIQYQFVLPLDQSNEGMEAILNKIATSGLSSFLSVLKMFGAERKMNFLSFPMEGLNLALDIKMTSKTLPLMAELDNMVLSYGGRVYLAKDARMKASFLEKTYPELPAFKSIVNQYNPNYNFSSLQAERLGLTHHNNNPSNDNLFMPNVLILGANSDIAKACASRFLSLGFSITLASRNVSALNDFAHGLDGEVMCLPFDALDFDSHALFYKGLTHKPNVVICAFGILPDEEEASRDFQKALIAIQSNYTGAVSILNIIAEDFKQRGEGSIIGISSVAGDRGRQTNYHYGSAKAGFTAYLSGLRGLLRPHGVHVGTIKPGFVRTKMIEGIETPGPLTASPAQVANACYKSYKKRRSTVYSKGIWRPVMWVIKHIPEFIFKRLSI